MNDRQIDEARSFLAAWPDTRTVELLLPDLNGILRGKRIGRRELLSLWRDGIAFPATGILLDSRGALIDGGSFWASTPRVSVVFALIAPPAPLLPRSSTETLSSTSSTSSGAVV